MLEEFRADHAQELMPMWRESFEFGVGIKDLHSIAEQKEYFWTVVVPSNGIQVAFLEGQIRRFVKRIETRPWGT